MTGTISAAVIGLRETLSHPGMLFLETPGGGDVLNFVEVKKPVDPEAGGLDHFGLHVAPRRFPAIQKRLRAAGVKVVGRRGRSSILREGPERLRPRALRRLKRGSGTIPQPGGISSPRSG